MPNTVASQNYDESTEQVSFLMVMGTIYTILLSFILGKALKKVLKTMFSLQVIIHMFFFSIPFPGNMMNIIKKIKPTISFDILKTLSKYTEGIFNFDKLG